ncbi:hypothetical protein OXE08_004518 [Salmonella enterica]|nr:hypothetical protein [Salmonella enterica]
MNKDLSIDTDTFDFFSLNDITDDERATYAPQPTAPAAPLTSADEVGPDGGVVDDARDLFDNDEERELEAEEAADPNNNVSDLQTPQDDEEVITLFNDLPDDAPMSFNGRNMTKADVAAAIAKIDEVNAHSEIVSDAAKNIDQIHRFLVREHARSSTAIDTNINLIQQRMNSGVSDVEYGNLSRQLQQAIEARNALDYSTDEKMRALDVERAEVVKFRINEEINTLSKTIPDWENRRSKVLSYAQAQKVNLNEVEKIWTPQLAEMFYKAYCYDQRRAQVKDEALAKAKAKAPRSQASAANAQRTQAASMTEQQRAALVNKAKRGELSEREQSDMFKYLID